MPLAPTRLMTAGAVVCATALVLAGCVAAPPPAAPPASGIYQSMSVSGARLDRETAASMISELRRGRGLGPITLDPALNRMAEEQAGAMARAGRISHESLAGSFKQRIARAGYPNGGMWENVGAGHDTLADAFTGWRSSPPHLKNMLQPKAARMGIAAVHRPGTRFEVFWALILADPNDPRVRVAAMEPPGAAQQDAPLDGAGVARAVPNFRVGAPGQIYVGGGVGR